MPPRLPFRRPPAPRFRYPALIAVGAGAVAAETLRVLWGALNGGDTDNAPDQIAALTAQSVADAARATVIEAVEGTEAPDEGTLATATTRVMREAASAGADITAAALGALDGTMIIYPQTGLGRAEATTAARSAAIAAAEEIGAAAAERVRRVLEGRESR